MVENKIDRFKILIRYIVSNNIAENQKALGVLLGYNNESYFSQIINCKVETPKDFIKKLKSIIPPLNEEWLLRGTGEMLAQAVTQTSSGNNSPNINGNGNSTSDVAMQQALAIIEKYQATLTDALKQSHEREARLLEMIEKYNNNNNKE